MTIPIGHRTSLGSVSSSEPAEPSTTDPDVGSSKTGHRHTASSALLDGLPARTSTDSTATTRRLPRADILAKRSPPTLPTEVIEQVASHLPRQQRVDLANAIPGVIQAQVKQAGLTRLASEVNGVAAARELLGSPTTKIGDALKTIRSLRGDLRSEPLLALGYRLIGSGHANTWFPAFLQPHDYQEEIDLFRQAVAELDEHDRSPLLTQLDQAASQGAESARAHIKSLTRAAILRGDTLPEVCEQFGIRRGTETAFLTGIAIKEGPAGAAVRAGKDPEEVARHYGIEINLTALECEAAKGVAGDAVRNGGNAVEVAAQYHITTEYGLRALQQAAIEERDGVKGPAARAVVSGHKVGDVARAFGLDGDVLESLEHIAFHESAAFALHNGEPIDSVLSRHGLHRHSWLKAAEEEAIKGMAGLEARNGKSVLKVAKKYGVITTQGMLALEREAVKGPAGDAVRKGGKVARIANKYGISTYFGIEALRALAPTS